ncbi:glycoside hydrolase family 65 protein, partial [Klebsiella michiganensis]|nr:glycoside hydrolase family 65 protein [Klebsiella michiganensis]
GILTESYRITTPTGKSFELGLTSFASMTRSELYVCRYEVITADFSEPIELSHKLNQQFSVNKTDDPRVASKNHQLEKEQMGAYQVWTAPNSQKQIAIRLHQEKQYLTVGEPSTSIFQVKLLQRFGETPFEQKVDEFSVLLKEQADYYRSFWQASDIQIVGDDYLQKGIRFNLFHLNQGAGRDGKTNFAAKGLTGEGYEGHYFWDTVM